MKIGILESIRQLRKGTPFMVDQRNSNRYRLVISEDDGSKTAYCFSTPIYNQKTRKLLHPSFARNGETIYATGSNSNITISDSVLLENAQGSCRLSLSGKVLSIAPDAIRTTSETIGVTTNGVTYTVNCSKDKPYRFIVDVGQPFLPVRENGKYFALMSEEFKPFVTVSCIGVTDASGNVIAPAEVTSRKVNDRIFELYIQPHGFSERLVCFEVNLYEPKLFQDTTVESDNPGMNNAFGSVAFIGNTKAYGEQWLYTRPDFGKLPEMLDRQIKKAVLHLPKLSEGNVSLSAYGVSARFCSFGSTWENRIPQSEHENDSGENDRYIDLDITHLLREQNTGFMKRSEGLILRTKVKDSGFSAIATGDSYYAPQILEINFR